MPGFMGATLLLCSKLLNLMNQCNKPTVKGMFLFFYFYCFGTVYVCDINGYMYGHTYMLVCVYAHACVGQRLT